MARQTGRKRLTSRANLLKVKSRRHFNESQHIIRLAEMRCCVILFYITPLTRVIFGTPYQGYCCEKETRYANNIWGFYQYVHRRMLGRPRWKILLTNHVTLKIFKKIRYNYLNYLLYHQQQRQSWTSRANYKIKHLAQNATPIAFLNPTRKKEKNNIKYIIYNNLNGSRLPNFQAT